MINVLCVFIYLFWLLNIKILKYTGQKQKIKWLKHNSKFDDVVSCYQFSHFPYESMW